MDALSTRIYWVRRGYELGFSFTPLGGEDGKRPLLGDWTNLPRPTLEESIKMAEAGNVGLRCGAASGNIVCLDWDLEEPPPIDWPRTWTFRTGRNHWGLLFRAAGPVKNQVKQFHEFCDVRGDGGQVVYPGSVNPQTSVMYRFVEGLSPDDIEIADLPEWVIEGDWRMELAAKMADDGYSHRDIAERIGRDASTVGRLIRKHAALRAALHENDAALRATDDENAYQDPNSSGERRSAASQNDAALHENDSESRSAASNSPQRCVPPGIKPYIQAAIDGEVQAIREALSGNRNVTLNRAALKLGHYVGGGEILEFELEQILVAASDPWVGVDDCTAAQNLATIKSGISAGKTMPRRAPGRQADPNRPIKPLRPPPPPKPLPPPPPSAEEVALAVLVPGAHVDAWGEYIEQGNHMFADQVLARIPPGTLYRRSGIVGQIIGGPGHREFEPSTFARIRNLVDQHLKLGQWEYSLKKGNHLVYLNCSHDMAGLVLDRAIHHDSVRELVILTSYPVFQSDWTLVQPGWNAASGIFYDQPPSLVGLEPILDVARGREFLDDLLVDFPFATPADAANFVGLMLTPLVRPAITSNVPIHLIMCTIERTGKSKLAENVFGQVILGKNTPATQLPSDEAEIEKRLLSLLLRARNAVHFDNIANFLDSPSLASLVTATEFDGRVLGSSKSITLPNRMTIIGSGNSVRATGEIVKRTIPIIITPATDHPEMRENFVHPDIEAYAAEVRINVLASLLGMIQSWANGGRPAGKKRLGGFERYMRTVGGIMAWSGIMDWGDNMRDWARKADPAKADLNELVRLWATTYSLGEVSAADLKSLADQYGIFSEYNNKPTENGRLTSFSRGVLLKSIDMPVGSWIIRRNGAASNARYYLEKG